MAVYSLEDGGWEERGKRPRGKGLRRTAMGERRIMQLELTYFPPGKGEMYLGKLNPASNLPV